MTHLQWRIPRVASLSIALVSLAVLANGCKKKEPTPSPAAQESPTAATEKSEIETSALKTIQGLPPSIMIKEVGFVLPGTVVIDEKRDRYLVSNANKNPMGKENTGFISKVSPAGEVTDLKWIEGGKNGVTLVSPKGMAIRNDILYVTDSDTIRKFSLEDGSNRGEIPIEKASFLNDIALGPNGALFVTDTGIIPKMGKLEPTETDAIYVIDENDKVTTLASGKALENPNGIVAVDEGFFVVSFTSGNIVFVSHSGEIRPAATLPGGKLDGIVSLPDGELVVTSWQTATLYKGTPNGAFAVLKSQVKTPSGLTYDAKRHQLVVPLAVMNALLIQPLGDIAKATADALASAE